MQIKLPLTKNSLIPKKSRVAGVPRSFRRLTYGLWTSPDLNLKKNLGSYRGRTKFQRPVFPGDGGPSTFLPADIHSEHPIEPYRTSKIWGRTEAMVD